MFKMLRLLKRNEAMSREEFEDYYENVHSKLGERFGKGHYVRYVRRYLTAMPDYGHPTAAADGDYDVAMEMWFEDRSDFDLVAERAALEADVLTADEEKIFDRSRTRAFSIVEVDSDTD